MNKLIYNLFFLILLILLLFNITSLYVNNNIHSFMLLFEIIVLYIFLIFPTIKIKINNLLIKNFNLRINKKNFFLVTLIMLFINIIFFLSYFPGFYTPDSFDTLTQGLKNKYYDNHPIFFSFIVKIINNVLIKQYYPYFFIIFQHLLFILIIIYLINTFKITLNIKKFQILFLILLFTNPVFYFMNTTLWKDIIYTYFLFLINLDIFFYLKNKKNNINSFKLIILNTLLINFRHNALFTLILLYFFIFILFFLTEKKLIKKTLNIIFLFILSIIISNLLIKDLLYKKILRTNDSFNYKNLSVFLTQMYYFSIPEIKKLKKNTYIYNKLTKVYPIENLKNLSYYPYLFDEIYFSGKFNNDQLLINKKIIQELFLKRLKNNYIETIKDILKGYSLIWNIFYFKNEITRIAPNHIYKFEKNVCLEFCFLETNPKILFLNNFFNIIYYKINSNKFMFVIWRPSFYLLISGIILLFMLKNNYKNIFIIPLITIFANFIPYITLAPIPDFRYFYINVLIFYFYLFLFFNILSKNKKSVKNIKSSS